jgi:hypothetical protein
MIKAIRFLLFLLVVTNLKAQNNNQIIQFTYNLDSSVVFIDNSPRNWYTLNITTDTLIQVENNIYFFNGKTIQIGSIQFDNGRPNGVKGSKVAEEFALESHKKWELDYQKKTLKKRLKNDELLYHNKNGKPFLIWWFETPKSKKIPEREIEIDYYNESAITTDTSAVETEVTHQLFLDFVIHGKTVVSISIPVLENESLDKEIETLKDMANTLNVYGGPIDLEVLSFRLENQNKYVFQDSLNQVSINLPIWYNIVDATFDRNVIVGSCPEKDNIYNSIALSINYSSDSIAIQNFTNRGKVSQRLDIDNLEVLSDTESEWRYFFTKDNGYFHCENINIKKGGLYYYIGFTATSTTYDFNKKRLDEFVNLIKNE